jgi:hypothetical protein
MFGYLVDYATPSAFSSTAERDALGFSANRRRRVRFHARVDHEKLALRSALRTLGELIWSDDTWLANDLFAAILDPIVTVHDDRVFFEAFSQDQSVYGLVVADRSIFTTEGEVVTGTTNVDFTAWLWAALGEMRSSRETWLSVETEGVEVTTRGSGGRFERKVEIPESWVRGFLTMQSAMAMPGTRLSMRPVDLIAAIRFLRFQKAKLSPRALRYELPPGEPARLVLEPWEQVVPLKGTEHDYRELRVIRTWGRRRLRLIEPLLPYADRVTVYLKGRALPSAYVVELGRVRFVMALSGWTGNDWSRESAFELAVGQRVDESVVGHAATALIEGRVITVELLADRLGVDRGTALRALQRLCRRGRCVYDLERREYRHRELFEAPIDEARFHPPSPRLEAARRIIDENRVLVARVDVKETRKIKKLKTPDGSVLRDITYLRWSSTSQEETPDSQ